MKCARCGLDLEISKDSYPYPIDPPNIKPRRWVCYNCLDESDVDENSSDAARLVGDILDSLVDEKDFEKGAVVDENCW